ncbi:MAG TPA: histidine kinase [Parafilimonas sp.]|nr:histidine kinase [Parafilimonas sp.]
MKHIFAIITAFLFPLIIAAQAFQVDKPALPIDSLIKALPLLYDSARVDCLNELSRAYMETAQKMNADSALAFARQAYKEAVSAGYAKGSGEACLRLGLISFWHSWNYIESEKHYREAISWYQKTKDQNGLGYGYSGVGASLLNQGLPDEATKFFERASVHFKEAGNKLMMADIKDWFSYIYESKGDFEKQFENVKKGFNEKRRLNDKRGIIWSYYNLSQIYQSVEDFETALDYMRLSFQQAREQSINWQPYRSMGHLFLAIGNYDSAFFYFSEMLRLQPSDAPALAGLGRLLMFQGKYGKALDHLQQASINFKKSADTGRQISVLADIAKTYAAMKYYEEALQYARECLIVSSQTGNKTVMKSAYEVYREIYEGLGNADSALFYHKQFVTLKDSLDDAKYQRQHLRKLALYKVESKAEEQQARINLLNTDNQLKQRQLKEEAFMKKILIACLVVLILLSVIIMRNIVLKRRNEKLRLENVLKEQQLLSERKEAELQKQTSELEMQALRAQMNPHFIFNCLNSINRFILKNETEPASDYLTKFSRLIRMVLNNSKHKYITLNEELDCLELYIQMEQLRFKNSFNYKIKCSADIDMEETLVPPLLIQPFAENAIWHGLMQKESGEGNLAILLQQKNEILECTITDNGVGRKVALELSRNATSKNKSLGLQITKERIALLDNEQGEHFIEIEDLYDDNGNAMGTKVIIRIKYKIAIEKLYL